MPEHAPPFPVLGTMPGTLMETLGITITEATPERVVATMPVTPAHHQPYGILHGGASVALAETVASFGSSVSVDLGRRHPVGLEINANHVRPVRDGVLTAVGTPVHKGRSTQIWSVEIRDDSGRLVCVSRCTLALVEARAWDGGRPAAQAPGNEGASD
ncbi:MAG TPA: PaaI family thioesterase [Trueperaceae bacterium]|nr:PaaI family thioesterase [Trueperaceae bacterium]